MHFINSAMLLAVLYSTLLFQCSSGKPPKYVQLNLQSSKDLRKMLAIQCDMLFPREEPIFRYYIASMGGKQKNDQLKVLDVGCGPGVFANRLHQAFPNDLKITGIDIEQSNIDLANSEKLIKTSENPEFLVGNAYELNNAVGGEYDIITIRSVLYTLPNPDIVVKNCISKSKQGGVLHIIDEDYEITSVAGPTELDSDLFFESMRSAFVNKNCCPTMGRKLLELCRKCSNELGIPTEIKITNLPITTAEERNKQLLHDMFISWRRYAPFIADNCDTKLRGKTQQIDDMYKDVANTCIKKGGFGIWQCFCASCWRKK